MYPVLLEVLSSRNYDSKNLHHDGANLISQISTPSGSLEVSMTLCFAESSFKLNRGFSSPRYLSIRNSRMRAERFFKETNALTTLH